MQTRNILESVRFAPDKMVKSNLFATKNVLYDLYCLEPGQSQKVHSHDASDKIYLVLSGHPTVLVGDEEQVVEPNQAVLAACGQMHGLRNDGKERATLLVVTAPSPI